MRITTRAAGVGEGLAGDGEVPNQDQVGVAMVTTILEMAVEMAVELLDGAVAEDVMHEVLLRCEEEDEDEEVHQQ